MCVCACVCVYVWTEKKNSKRRRERDVLRRRHYHRKLAESDCVNSNISSRKNGRCISSDCVYSSHTILRSNQVFVGRIKYHQALRTVKKRNVMISYRKDKLYQRWVFLCYRFDLCFYYY